MAGKAPPRWTKEDEAGIKKLEPKADRIEIITSQTGHMDVQDAWRDLLLKGMAHIRCKIAVFNETGDIKFTGKEFRLCG